MIIQAGDLGIELDTGLHPDGKTLQRLENGKWVDFILDGESVTWRLIWKA